jgi:hypothetical protein
VETSLHRQLKEMYAGSQARTEVRLESFRIDAVVDDQLFEIQHGSLAAIRRKILRLVESHRVVVVKPIIAEKILVKRSKLGGKVVERRRSPKRESLLDLFDELIYFVGVFPHPQLRLEVPVVEMEEWRYPGHGRRRRWRRDDHVVEDQKLVAVRDVHTFTTADDLISLLPKRLPNPFHTGDLADGLGVHRVIAQRIAYCLRKMGGFAEKGKRGNARLYELRRAG